MLKQDCHETTGGKHPIYPVIMTLMLAILVGCAAKGNIALKDLPDTWPPIGTTKQEVQDRLGSPSTSTMSHDENGQPEELWHYRYEEGPLSQRGV